MSAPTIQDKGGAPTLKIFQSAKRAMNTLRWLKPLAGSFPAAALIMVKRKLSPNALHSASFNHRHFRFRGTDSNALLEVFHEGEYGFLKPNFAAKTSPVVVDVGAHIGSFALWAFDQAPNARILSVEADPITFSVLAKNQSLNEGRWEIINRAAADTDNAEALFSDAGPSMSHRISSEGTITVQTISLASLIKLAAGEGMIDVLKIDIEGAEEQFICSEPELLRRVRCLVVELHPSLCDVDRVQRVLSSKFSHIREITGRTSTKPLLHCEARL
jgi:FkbM family methyltransferase